MTIPEGTRVIYVYKVYVPELIGGIPEIIRLLASRLGGAGEIVVARLRGIGRTDAVDGVPVRRSTTLAYFWSLPIAPFFLLLLWRRMRRADLVDYHFPFPLVDLALALWLPQRVALIVHWHSEIVAQKAALPYVGWLFRHTLRRADRILVSSTVMVEKSPLLRAVARKCVVIPFGVDANYWATLDDSERRRVEELRQRHARLVLTIGRLVPYKGIDVLVDAMANVNGQLIIAGAGPLHDKLAARVKERGIDGRVFLTDFVERSELKCLLHACDVFVLPSVTANESFGLTQLEAMAVGKPIVNTRLPTGVPWVARDGEEALTVTPGSSAELTAAITQLLDDPALARSLGERGKMRVNEQFSLTRYLDDTAAAFSAALDGRRGHSARASGG